MLVDMLPYAFAVKSELGHHDGSAVLWRSDLPMRFDCEMRMTSIPSGRSRWKSIATAHVSSQSASLLTRLNRHGCLIVEHGADKDCPEHWSLPVFAPRSWHRVSQARCRNRVVVRVDGRPYYTAFHALTPADSVRCRVSTSGCDAKFRNLRFYVLSRTKADNPAIEKSLIARRNAIRLANAATARKSHRELVRFLAGIPETRRDRERMDREARLFEKILSDPGLPLCTKEVQETATGRYALRLGKPQGATMTFDSAQRSPKAWRKLSLGLVLPDDIELSGVLSVENPDRNTFLSLLWHSSVFDTKELVTFWPGRGKAVVGEYFRGGLQLTNVDFSSPLPFCLRVRGRKAALFLRFGAKPDGRLEGLQRTGDGILLRARLISKNARIHLSKLVVRHLPKGVPLDAPVRMPDARSGASQPSGQGW